MSDGEPHIAEEQPEAHMEEQHVGEDEDAAADTTAMQEDEDYADSAALEPMPTEPHAADQPEEPNPDISTADAESPTVAGDATDAKPEDAESSDVQQAAEDERAAQTDSRLASSLQQDETVNGGPEDTADAQGSAHQPSVADAPASQQLAEDWLPITDTADAYAAAQADSATEPLQTSGVEDEIPGSAASGLPPIAEDEFPAAYASALSNPELDPDHPLLARAQTALGKQLLAIKYRLESDVREKAVALQVLLRPGS